MCDSLFLIPTGEPAGEPADDKLWELAKSLVSLMTYFIGLAHASSPVHVVTTGYV